MATKQPEMDSSKLDEELLAIVLDGIENANQRSMLEYCFRKKGLQWACMLKDEMLSYGH